MNYYYSYTSDTDRYETYTNSNAHDHRYRSISGVCPCRKICDNWGISCRCCRAPISDEWIGDLKVDEESRKLTHVFFLINDLKFD